MSKAGRSTYHSVQPNTEHPWPWPLPVEKSQQADRKTRAVTYNLLEEDGIDSCVDQGDGCGQVSARVHEEAGPCTTSLRVRLH